jgi:N-acetylmuramoyl-L-alanine amidase
MQNRAKDIRYIVIHCQAGHGTLVAMQNFWKNTLGWKSPGYHTWINYEGSQNKLLDYNKPSNGVAGFNSQCLHISYRGGVEQTNNVKAKDTRTQAQKAGIIREIYAMKGWLLENGNDCKNVMILGHRDFSNDQNKNGAIEPWERIKECPSFDAYSEYADFMAAENPNYKDLKLPNNR